MDIAEFILLRRSYISDVFLNMGHIAFGGLVIGQLISDESFKWLSVGITAGIYFIGFIIKEPKN